MDTDLDLDGLDVGARMRRAGRAVGKAARGGLVKWGVGLDPVVRDRNPMRCWWARAHVQAGRRVVPVTVEGYASGPDAAEALAEAVDRFVKARARRA